MGQYVCYDKDGYTNVRKGAGTQYEIVDKVSKYELFYSSDHLCSDGNSLDTLLTWIPFVKSIYGDTIGFIYKKNIKSLDDMPKLWWENVNDTLISCSNDTVRINLVLRDFDKNNHVIEYAALDEEWKYIMSVDGKQAKRIHYPIKDNNTDVQSAKEIKALYIEWKNKRIDLPIDYIKNYFNPLMVVHLGYENELYIYICVGDASESYGIYLSVVDGEIKYTLDHSAC